MGGADNLDSAAAYFGGMIGEYDSLIARAVPRYAEMTDRLIQYLPRGSARVLELGCGTGNLTLRLAAALPGAAITVVDAAPEMVAITRERLRDAGHAGAWLVVGRFEEVGFDAGSFDLVTSCISLHHVADKGPLYRHVHRWLAPGGSLVFADQFAGATERNHAVNWGRWLEFCRERGGGRGCTEEEIASLLAHAEAHDHYTAVPEHFRLLGVAGFDSARMDCVWRNWIWGIITAERS